MIFRVPSPCVRSESTILEPKLCQVLVVYFSLGIGESWLCCILGCGKSRLCYSLGYGESGLCNSLGSGKSGLCYSLGCGESR